ISFRRRGRIVTTLKEGQSKETAPLEPPPDRPGAERLYVIVVSEGICSTHRLPEVGEVSIGRSEAADIRIDQPWISRQHAILHVGPKLRLQDLGSANGTSVRGARIDTGQFVDLAPGDAIDLGRSMLLVQKLSVAAHQQRVWPHGYFMELLARECTRASNFGLGFVVVRIQAESTTSAREIEAELAQSLRAVDIVAAYGPGEYELLVVERTEPQALDLVTQMAASLAARGCRIRVGM